MAKIDPMANAFPESLHSSQVTNVNSSLITSSNFPVMSAIVKHQAATKKDPATLDDSLDQANRVQSPLQNARAKFITNADLAPVTAPAK